MKTPARDTSSAKDIKIRLGQNIAAARKAKGWTQQELANKVGVEHHLISRTESGTTTPSFARLIEVADALDVSLAALVGGTSAKVGDVADEITACLKRLREPDRHFILGMVQLWTDKLAKK